MAKFARIEDNRCAEFINFDPAGKFHPSIEWIEVPVALEEVVDHTWVKSGTTVAPASLDDLRSKIKATVAAKRYEREIAGLAVVGSTVATDRESQAKIHATLFGFDKGFTSAIEFKTQSGFVTFNAAQFAQLAGAVFAYVQACFSAEGTHSTAIDALTTVEALATYDVAAGWPNNA